MTRDPSSPHEANGLILRLGLFNMLRRLGLISTDAQRFAINHYYLRLSVSEGPYGYVFDVNDLSAKI